MQTIFNLALVHLAKVQALPCKRLHLFPFVSLGWDHTRLCSHSSSFCIGKTHQNRWLHGALQNFPFHKMFLKCLFLLPTQKINHALKYYVRQKVWVLGSSKNNTSDLEKAFFLISEYNKIFLDHSLPTYKGACLFILLWHICFKHVSLSLVSFTTS